MFVVCVSVIEGHSGDGCVLVTPLCKYDLRKSDLWKLVLIVQAACHQVQHVKAGQTHFFIRDPISNRGDKEEILGDGTDIDRGSSDESNQEM